MIEKKYYWLKLHRNFFKRHDIEIIESMPNGKDYVLFYLKLLVESIDHEGSLRFSETVPYNEEMLATITRTNVDIVRSAVSVFAKLGMMEQMDDGTLYMSHVNNMIGDETEWAKKKREYRIKQKENQLQIQDKLRTKKDNVRQELELEKDIEIDNTSPVKPLKDKYTESFKTFYDAYPRKEARGQALKAYNAARRKGIAAETILERLETYKARLDRDGTDRKYMRLPATFLNNLDDYECAEPVKPAAPPEREIDTVTVPPEIMAAILRSQQPVNKTGGDREPDER